MLTLFKFYNNDKKTFKRHEASEAVLFTCRIYEKLGKNKEALDFLQNHDKEVVDMVKKEEYLGCFQEALGNHEQAVDHYEALLRLNSANLETYIKLLKAKGVKIPSSICDQMSESEQQLLKQELLFYAEKLPRINAHIRIGLRYLHGENFAEFLNKYFRPLLIKGVPSVIQEIKEFYNQP